MKKFLAYTSRGFMPPTTTATNQLSDGGQSLLYPQTSPLASHRPTRPTAVVPPLPKDPIISSLIGSTTTTPTSSMAPPSSSNYQQVSPQKSLNKESNYQKQVEKKKYEHVFFSLYIYKKTVRKENVIFF